MKQSLPLEWRLGTFFTAFLSANWKPIVRFEKFAISPFVNFSQPFWEWSYGRKNNIEGLKIAKVPPTKTLNNSEQLWNGLLHYEGVPLTAKMIPFYLELSQFFMIIREICMELEMSKLLWLFKLKGTFFRVLLLVICRFLQHYYLNRGFFGS